MLLHIPGPPTSSSALYTHISPHLHTCVFWKFRISLNDRSCAEHPQNIPIRRLQNRWGSRRHWSPRPFLVEGAIEETVLPQAQHTGRSVPSAVLGIAWLQLPVSMLLQRGPGHHVHDTLLLPSECLLCQQGEPWKRLVRALLPRRQSVAPLCGPLAGKQPSYVPLCSHR